MQLSIMQEITQQHLVDEHLDQMLFLYCYFEAEVARPHNLEVH